MSVLRVGKEIEIHSAQGAPIARLRARFGFLDNAPTPARPPRVAAELKLLDPPANVSP